MDNRCSVIAGQRGAVVPRERIDVLADDHSEVLEAHPVDALMDRRDELDEGDDLPAEDLGAWRGRSSRSVGQQFQSADVEPYYVLFEDFTHVKFYRSSLYDGVVGQGATFDGFVHVDDWVPQRLVTATGPNPLPL
jgi:hypothetical protein